MVDTWWQLENALDELALDGANNVLDVEESVFPLPTALIPNPVMGKLRKAVGEHRKTGTPISKCIRVEKMDLHMMGSTTVSGALYYYLMVCEFQVSVLV